MRDGGIVGDKEALDHAIKKWNGLLKKNLMKHDIRFDGKVFSDTEEVVFPCKVKDVVAEGMMAIDTEGRGKWPGVVAREIFIAETEEDLPE